MISIRASRHSLFWCLLACLASPLAAGQSDFVPGGFEIDGIRVSPDIVTEGQPFTVTLTGYNLSGSYGLLMDESDFELVVTEDEITLTSNDFNICDFSPRPQPPPNVAPERVSYPLPGMPQGKYLLRIQHGVFCSDTEATQSLTVYHNDQSELVSFLETPREGQHVSGVGLIRGWACYTLANDKVAAGPVIGQVAYTLDDGSMTPLAYATSRTDTQQICGEGKSQTGFGAALYWGNFGEGEHEITLYVDGAEQARHTFTVVAPPEGFMKGQASQQQIKGFPEEGKSVTLEWSESDQNFVIVEFN